MHVLSYLEVASAFLKNPLDIDKHYAGDENGRLRNDTEKTQLLTQSSIEVLKLAKGGQWTRSH